MNEEKLNVTTVAEGVFRLSANGGPEILFESMWPLPHGVAMNSYVVRGKETAIIDGVCGWDGAPETLFTQLEELVRSFYGFDKNLRPAADGDSLDLGHGKKLLFKEIPNVHWP